MGNSRSKSKGGSRKKGYDMAGRNGQSKHPDTSIREKDGELLSLRHMIENNPEIFVLNNLMMCVQFFQNYEEEIEHVKESLTSSREADLNERLPPQKHVLLPDVLQEHIARNVAFTSSRQMRYPTVEPLQPVRIYIVHDNIDITEEHCSIHYSSLSDSMTYNILLKPTDQEGCVQLQLLDEVGTSKGTERDDAIDLSSIAENDDELYSDGDSVYGPRPRLNFIKSSEFGHARSLPNLVDCNGLSENRNVQAETDYENSSSERGHPNKMSRSKGELSRAERRRGEKQPIRTKMQGSNGNSRASSISSGYRSDSYAIDSDSSPSQGLKLTGSFNHEKVDERWIANAEIPERCFRKVTYTANGELYDPSEDKKQPANSHQRRIKSAMRRRNYDLSYANSTEFMKHFTNIFIYRLANNLGFDGESMEDAKRGGPIIYCDKVMVSNVYKHSRVEQYEIEPTIWLQWPSCAQEWLDRPRNAWPDSVDVEKIKNFGCYVVPEGLVPRKGTKNGGEDLKWQLTFPAAERYLETCMTQSQVQIYLIALMLHKTFLRPVFDTMLGLTTAHIRHKLFTMIEDNDRPYKWPDNKMGECLLKLLKSLYHGISQNEPTLRDYFIRSRNLFQRVPCEHLLHTQKQLKRIIENPVMYIFHAMENIQYSKNFFPRLDHNALFRILTADTLTLINPALVRQIQRPMAQPNAERVSQDDGPKFWDTVKNQRKKYSVQLVNNKTLINPRKAADSIIEISIRCAQFEDPRLCALLDFFIQHFIKMAERCHHYRAYRQKTVYLDHADRLAVLLFEYQLFKEEARGHRDRITVLRKNNANSKSQDDPPKTPKRNPETAIFNVSLNDRFTQKPSERKSAAASSAARNEQPRKESDDGVDRNESVATTTAIVHKAEHEDPDGKILKSTTSISGTSESEYLERGTLNKSEQVVKFLESSESIPNETTYI